MSYAKVDRPFPNYRGPVPHQPATTGWTAPSLIYEKMRQVNMSALALNGDVGGNVAREAFKGAWTTWFTTWSAFFAKYQGTFARLGAVTYTDELYQQVLSYESQLVTWYAAYAREVAPDGKPLPPASGLPPQPNVPIPPARDLPTAPPGEGLVIPWWGWVLGGLAVAGAGYATYLYVQKARAIRRVLDDKVVPGVLQVYGGPAGGQLAEGYGQLAAARDPYAGQVSFRSTFAPFGPAPGGSMQIAPPGMMPPPYSRYLGT